MNVSSNSNNNKNNNKDNSSEHNDSNTSIQHLLCASHHSKHLTEMNS